MSKLKSDREITQQDELAIAFDEFQTGGHLKFPALWELAQGVITPVLNDRIKDRHVRADISQNVALKFVDRIHKRGDPIRDIGAYLAQVARNECVNYWRARSRDPLYSTAEITEFNEPESKDVSEGVEQKIEMVCNLMKPLPEESKNILSMHYWQAKSAIEIGKVLKLCDRRVHQILKGIRRTLKRLFNVDHAPHRNSVTRKIIDGDTQ